MQEDAQKRLVDQFSLNGWVLWLAVTIAAAVFFSSEVALGALVGGLLTAVNLQLLKRAVHRALRPGSRVTPKNVLPGFYLCFAATCLIITGLIYFKLVDPLGLLLGLSSFLMNLFSVALKLTVSIIYRFTKEAV